jgi:hypothetical protein
MQFHTDNGRCAGASAHSRDRENRVVIFDLSPENTSRFGQSVRPEREADG